MPATVKKYKDGELVSTDVVDTVKKPRKPKKRGDNVKSQIKDTEESSKETSDS